MDASDTGVRAVSSQHLGPDERLHPCASFSHKFSVAEKNYDVGDRELLGVKWALEECRHWLKGTERPLIVWTEPKYLSYIQTAKRLNSCQARWLNFFLATLTSLTYCAGSRNIKPDALSCLEFVTCFCLHRKVTVI